MEAVRGAMLDPHSKSPFNNILIDSAVMKDKDANTLPSKTS